MGIGERQSPCLQSVLDPARALDEAAVGTRAEDAKPTSALVHEQPKAAIAGGPKYARSVSHPWVLQTVHNKHDVTEV